MSSWSGFTDEDLQKVKRQSSGDESARTGRGNFRGRPGQRKRPQRPAAAAEASSAGALPPEQRLSQPKQVQSKKENVPAGKPEVKAEIDKTSHNTSGTGTGVQSQPDLKDMTVKTDSKDGDGGWENEMKEEVEDLMDEEQIVSMEMCNLDKFREQQKMIEELNKKKRQMLASAIQQRQKKAKAEAAKLTKIQSELDRMDQMLTIDVSLIRDKIEDASRHYMEAQKRYDRAEKEFIDSKMHMFYTQEQKEQLTEHLYTVIHQNEVRKAKKLKELMEKLEMENSGEDSEITELVRNMEMPSLTVLNTLQAKTITGPRSPPANPRIAPQDELLKNESKSEVKNESETKSDVKNETTDQSESTAAIAPPQKTTDVEKVTDNKPPAESQTDAKCDTTAVSSAENSNVNNNSVNEGKSQESKTNSVASSTEQTVPVQKETIVINNTDKSAVKC